MSTAIALSVFAHNSRIPLIGVEITYSARYYIARYVYQFYRYLTPSSRDLELPLPSADKVGDILTVGSNVSWPYSVTQAADPFAMGDGGMYVWFDVGS